MDAPGSPRLALIAAVARNGVIGRDNAMPWHLPADLKRFRALTTGHAVIMGRKTFESIGRPLPDRRNIVVSRDAGYAAPGCDTATSVQRALALGAGEGEIFVIGGAQIYAQALPLAQRVYLTEIDAEYPGDAHFPQLASDQWRETSRERHAPEDGTPGYSFVIYDRI